MHDTMVKKDVPRLEEWLKNQLTLNAEKPQLVNFFIGIYNEWYPMTEKQLDI